MNIRYLKQRQVINRHGVPKEPMNEFSELLVDGFAESHSNKRDQTLAEESKDAAELEDLWWIWKRREGKSVRKGHSFKQKKVVQKEGELK